MVLLGAVLVAGPTFGFSTIAGDRGVSVSTASDDVALLGINVSNEVEFGDRTESTADTAEVADLKNNLNEDINSVDAAVTSVEDDDENAVQVANNPELDGGITSGGTVSVELECAGIETENTSNVTVTVSSAEAGSVTISNKPITIENVYYDCSGDGTAPGDTEFEELTATANTDNQNRVESITFEYQFDDGEDTSVEFTVSIGDGEWTATTDPEDREETVNIRPKQNAGTSIEVIGEIDGGGDCFTTFERTNEPVDVCD